MTGNLPQGSDTSERTKGIVPTTITGSTLRSAQGGVQWSWTLDDASDVTIGVSELFAQDGTLIANKVLRAS